MRGSVTQRIREIKQPWGGYIRVKQFAVKQLEDGNVLEENENISPALVGTAVDYLTRYLMGASKEMAFAISLMGADIIEEESFALNLLARIEGLDKRSIDAACKLTGYDVCFRAGVNSYIPVELIEPNEVTCENIRTMVNRSLSFWETYGPIVLDGFCFEGAYTEFISKGDGDFLTRDTLWDFKVSRGEPKIKYTLQLLIYYLMGRKSIHEEFSTVDKLGIYNPRLNKVYVINVRDIPNDVIDEVSRDVIGYGLSQEETEERIEVFFQSTVIVEDGTTTIAKRKYLNTLWLNEVIIPDSVKNVEEGAFYGCRCIRTVYYKGTPSDWGTIKFAANNRELQKASVLFYMESKPEVTDKYWHFDEDGTPVPW